MADDRSAITLEVVVPGTPEVVWRAVATGPGITSWFVPHAVEEWEGGTATASFGPEPEMQVPGRVVVWDPPRRVVFDGGEGVAGLVYEWLVEPVSRDRCRVRFVNTGFGDGGEWDAQYDQLLAGWRMFLTNLRLQLEHHPGAEVTPMLPSATWEGPPEHAWRTLTSDLGLPWSPRPGDRVRAEGPAPLAGEVAAVGPWHVALVLSEPCPGTGFLAVEGEGDHVMVSVWLYLLDADAADRDEPRWAAWLGARSADVGAPDDDGAAPPG